MRFPWLDPDGWPRRDLTELWQPCLGDWVRYLPRTAVLAIEPGIPDRVVDAFVRSSSLAMRAEIEYRLERRHRFVASGAMGTDEHEWHLTSRCFAQPWVLVLANDGGLPVLETSSVGDRATGLICCYSMTNHGVGWRTDDHGQVEGWLATGRKPAKEWDWDSDVGHESAHAAFASVPLFTQTIAGGQPPISIQSATSDSLTDQQFAMMCYMFSEISVSAVRGELRETQTGLPVIDDRRELETLFRLSEEIFPRCRFEESLERFVSTSDRLTAEDPALLVMGAACLRAVDVLRQCDRGFEVPDLAVIRECAHASGQRFN
jgi:hypothetical protein